MKNEHLVTSIVSVLVAITGLAIIAVLVSNKSNTSNVFGAFGSAISNMLCKALSPVTGGSCAGSSIPSVNSTISFPGISGGIGQ